MIFCHAYTDLYEQSVDKREIQWQNVIWTESDCLLSLMYYFSCVSKPKRLYSLNVPQRSFVFFFLLFLRIMDCSGEVMEHGTGGWQKRIKAAAVDHYFRRQLKTFLFYSACLVIVGTAHIVCGAGFTKRYGVRPSVRSSMGPKQQTHYCRFAVVGPAGRRYRSQQRRAARANAGSATLSA